jgi:hypothetical protein
MRELGGAEHRAVYSHRRTAGKKPQIYSGVIEVIV